MKTKDTIASLKRIISEKEEELKAAQDAAESAQNTSGFRLRAYNDLVGRYQKVQITNNRWEKAYEALAHRVERCHKRILLEINTRKTLRSVLGLGTTPLPPNELVAGAVRFASEHKLAVAKLAESEDRYDRVIRAANEDRRLHELKVQALTTQNRIFEDKIQELTKANQSLANAIRAARDSERTALDNAAHNHKLYDLACKDRSRWLIERQTLLQRLDAYTRAIDGQNNALDSCRSEQIALEHQLSDARESLRDRYVELEAAGEVRKEISQGKIPVRYGWIIFWRTFKHWVARRPVAAQWTKEEI